MLEKLKFASENEALQYLADIVGKKIKVAIEKKGKGYMEIISFQYPMAFDEFTDKSTGKKGIDAFFRASKDDMMDYLVEWEFGDNMGKISKEKPQGPSFEKKFGSDIYIMTFNRSMEYATLTKEIEVEKGSPNNPSKLVKTFMDRENLTRDEAEDAVDELRDRVEDGESPEDVLEDEGIESDYVLELV